MERPYTIFRNTQGDTVAAFFKKLYEEGLITEIEYHQRISKLIERTYPWYSDKRHGSVRKRNLRGNP